MKKHVFFQMHVDEEFLRMLDNMRRWEDDLPSRSEMARRLLNEAAARRLLTRKVAAE